MKKSTIIEYTNILHEYGLSSKQANTFTQAHKDDQKFQKRAIALEKIWIKNNILPQDNNPPSAKRVTIGAVCLIVVLGILSMVLIF